MGAAENGTSRLSFLVRLSVALLNCFIVCSHDVTESISHKVM